MKKLVRRKTIATLVDISNPSTSTNTHDKQVNELLDKLSEVKDKEIETSVRHAEFTVHEHMFFVTIFITTFGINQKDVYEKIIAEASK